jgi:hypothetical protein
MTKEATIRDALFAVQQAAPAISKSTDNPFFKSKYASLPDIWEAIRSLLGEHKLYVSHTLHSDPEGDFIVTQIIHVPTGSLIESNTRITLAKNTAQEYGSYITYMRRYALSAMLGLVTDEDDDGNAASQAKPKPEPKPDIKPVDDLEMSLLKTGLMDAKSMDELAMAQGNARAAWSRMSPEQKKTLTKEAEIASKRLVQAP